MITCAEAQLAGGAVAPATGLRAAIAEATTKKTFTNR
jgi:hypothetical protein